jgi:hypothetical protein
MDARVRHLCPAAAGAGSQAQHRGCLPATAVYHHIGGFKPIGPGMLLRPDFYVGWLVGGALHRRHARNPSLARPRRVSARDVAMSPARCFQLRRTQTSFFPAGLPGRALRPYKALVMPVA